MIDAKTALKMTEEVRQKRKNKAVWENIEKQIITKINAGKQVCILEVFSDSSVSKNEIVERLVSLGYSVTENSYNLDEFIEGMEKVAKELGSAAVVKKEPVFVHELIVRW